MDPAKVVRVGYADLMVTQFGFGGGTLGDRTELTCDHQAEFTVETACASGVAHFDTSPWYGNSKSVHRVERIFRTKPRDEFALTTKVGQVYKRTADPKTFYQTRWPGWFQFYLDFDYSCEGFQRSYEQSLMRLGITSVNGMLIHDFDP